jgi:hypothetical protein
MRCDSSPAMRSGLAIHHEEHLPTNEVLRIGAFLLNSPGWCRA